MKQRGFAAVVAVVLMALLIGFGIAGSSKQVQANHTGATADEMTIFSETTGAGVSGTCTSGAVPTCTVLNPTASGGDGDGDGGTGASGPSPVAVGGTVKIVLDVNKQSGNLFGYQAEIAWLDAIMDYVSDTPLDTDLTLCAPGASSTFGPLELFGGGLGCGSSAGAGAMFQNPVHEFTLKCVTAGNTYVAIVDKGSDPATGTTLIAVGGADDPSQAFENQLPNPLPPPATVAAVVVACLQPVDISVTKTGPATAANGTSSSYAITISNTGPGTVNVDMSDGAPVGTTFTSIDNGPQCTFTAANATCTALPIPAGGSVVVNVGVTFNTCGMKHNAVGVQTSSGQSVIDANPGNNTSSWDTQVDCAVLTVLKTGPATAVEGSTVVYNVQICNDGGGTAATNVVVSDVPGPAPVPSTYASIASGACVNSTVTVVGITGVGQHCNTSSATQDAANGGPSNQSQACTQVTPNFPTFNGQRKDCDPSSLSTETTCNIFLFKDSNKVPHGSIVINEQLNIPPDIDTCNDDDDGDGAPCAGDPSQLPAPYQAPQDQCLVVAENYIPHQTAVDCNGGEVAEGLGAIEFQVKYDHKLFQQPVVVCTPGLGSNRILQPVVSVITENWTLFGCVTKDDPSTPGIDPGVIDPAFVVATLTLNVQNDLFQRIRPTKDNGVITDLLDENCEAADIFGMPWQGTVQGGLLPECGDATITIRMLEGDIDLDCQVTIADDQGIAFRYGSFFGNLLYNRFFDLEPNIAPDFDIDIKDLQTVFGRNGSTCTNPIPTQNPGSQVPDP